MHMLQATAYDGTRIINMEVFMKVKVIGNMDNASKNFTAVLFDIALQRLKEERENGKTLRTNRTL